MQEAATAQEGVPPVAAPLQLLGPLGRGHLGRGQLPGRSGAVTGAVPSTRSARTRIGGSRSGTRASICREEK